MSNYVYFIRPVGMDGPVKIGFSTDPERRRRELERSSPYKLEVAAKIAGDRLLEIRIHHYLRSSRLRGEWFEATEGLSSMITSVANGLSPFPEIPADMGELIDRVGLEAIQAHFGISRQAVHYWRTKGVPAMHRKTLAMLGAVAGHSMPELVQ